MQSQTLEENSENERGSMRSNRLTHLQPPGHTQASLQGLHAYESRNHPTGGIIQCSIILNIIVLCVQHGTKTCRQKWVNKTLLTLSLGIANRFFHFFKNKKAN